MMKATKPTTGARQIHQPARCDSTISWKSSDPTKTTSDQQGQGRRQLVGDDLRARAHRAEHRPLVVARPAGGEDAEHADGADAQHEKQADVEPHGLHARREGDEGQATKVAAKQISGARWKMKRSASSGVMFSLPNSFSPSASVWSMPCGPTRIGPRRCCMCAATLRSTQISASASTERKPASIAATRAIFTRSTTQRVAEQAVSQSVTAGGTLGVPDSGRSSLTGRCPG